MGDERPGARLSDWLGEPSPGTALYLFFLGHAAFLGVAFYASRRRDPAYGVSILVMIVGGIKHAWDDITMLLT